MKKIDRLIAEARSRVQENPPIDFSYALTEELRELVADGCTERRFHEIISSIEERVARG